MSKFEFVHQSGFFVEILISVMLIRYNISSFRYPNEKKFSNNERWQAKLTWWVKRLFFKPFSAVWCFHWGLAMTSRRRWCNILRLNNLLCEIFFISISTFALILTSYSSKEKTLNDNHYADENAIIFDVIEPQFWKYLSIAFLLITSHSTNDVII